MTKWKSLLLNAKNQRPEPQGPSLLARCMSLLFHHQTRRPGSVQGLRGLPGWICWIWRIIRSKFGSAGWGRGNRGQI